MRSRVNNDLLLQMVRDHPYLYDNGHPRYKDTLLKESKWAAIAAHLKAKDSTVIKTRWKTLRDRFRREKTDHEKRKQNSKGKLDAQPPKWRLYPILATFLEKTMEFHSPNSNILTTDEIEDSSLSTPTLAREVVLEFVSPPPSPSLRQQTGETVTSEQQIDSHSSNSTPTNQSPEPCEESVTRKKRKPNDIDGAILSLMQDVNCSLTRAHETSAAALTKFSGNNNDDAYFYGQCLIARFRAMPRQKFSQARLEIENILYRIESELNNQE